MGSNNEQRTVAGARIVTRFIESDKDQHDEPINAVAVDAITNILHYANAIIPKSANVSAADIVRVALGHFEKENLHDE